MSTPTNLFTYPSRQPVPASNAEVCWLDTPFTMYECVYHNTSGAAFDRVTVEPVTVIRFGTREHHALPTITFTDINGVTCEGTTDMFYMNRTEALLEAWWVGGAHECGESK